MIKKPFFLIHYILIVLLTGCVASPEEIMSPLQYAQNIPFHIKKTAYLYWQTGNQFSEDQPSMTNYSDPLVAVIGSAIESQERKSNPGRFTYTYGSAQQVVFMTSFKNILIKQHVFNNVELITKPKMIGPNDVLIIIKFRSTRISSMDENFAITLTVDMSIKDQNSKKFTRTYVVHNSPPENVWQGRTFKDQQTEVSQKLLSKLITSLEEWHTH